MITLKNATCDTEEIIKPTIFPDGTSQVWKIDESVLVNNCRYLIRWDFESEAELVHLAQVVRLAKNYGYVSGISIPFYPYARQDKEISNKSTFAAKAFTPLVISAAQGAPVSAIDIHSEQEGIINILPTVFIGRALRETGANIVCFPDKGAEKRYSSLVSARMTVMEKVRDQETGQITSLKTESGYATKDKDILIIDDICDGGATFKMAAKALYDLGARSVHLYTTHGIYSKGLQTIFDSGIKRIFNRKGEVYA